MASPLSLAESVDLLAPKVVRTLGRAAIAPRVIRVVDATSSPGQQVTVSVEIDAEGIENAIGFSLNYDATKLANPLVQLGSGAAGTALIPNTNIAGKVGVVLGLPAGVSLPAGTRQIVTVRFDVASIAFSGLTPLTFGDSPVFREVVDANADVLPTTFTSGSVNILGPTAARIPIRGRVVDAAGTGIKGARVIMTTAGGETRYAITNPFGYYMFDGVEAGGTNIFTVSSKRHVFEPSVIARQVVDEIADLDFHAVN